MERPYDELAAYFLRVPLDIFGVYQSILQAGVYQGHKYQPTTKCALLIALKGEAVFSFDEDHYPLSPGKVMFGGLHRHLEITVHSDEFEYFLVHFLPAEQEMSYLQTMMTISELRIEMDAVLLGMMKELRRLSAALGNLELLEKKTLFYRLLNKALQYERSLQNTESGHMMEQTIAYIRLHYMDGITLESLAEQHQMKPKYFSHLFWKYTGTSPINYLIQYRMNMAYELLLTAPFPIREIAKSVGYGDPYHFSRLFKKHCGMSPTSVKLLGRRNNPS